ncbi:ABC transporter permease [Pseudonocardia acaciae]|uniref:ABC transporter permease n=1 Tax=Pseudonocardia acaciae TaxID=551276 RepID=UPI0004913250|nr:ABC transporter permease [Pseudonocardia acaciae]
MNGVRGRLLAPVLAVVFAALLCAGALAISGDSPWLALRTMVGQVGQGTTAVDILNSAAVYYFSGLAVAVGFQMKLFNIGVEGQFRLAACVAAIVGGLWVLPPVLHTAMIILVAVLVGAGWASIAALLKAYRGVHEVISTIMLNAISTGVIAYLIRPDTFGVLRGNNISTQPIGPSGQFPGISLGERGTVFGMVFVAVALGLGYWFLLGRTRFGFDLRASGESATAASAGGVNARRMTVLALLLSGAMAGLVGLPELLGRDFAYTLNAPQGYGFTGIAIALLGRNHPVGVAFGSLLWAFLDKAALALDNVGVPREIAVIMQGVTVISVVIAYEIVRRYQLAAERRKVTAQASIALSSAGSGPPPPSAPPASAPSEA